MTSSITKLRSAVIPLRAVSSDVSRRWAHQTESSPERLSPFSSYRFSMIRLALPSWADLKLETTRHGMPRARDTGSGDMHVSSGSTSRLSPSHGTWDGANESLNSGQIRRRTEKLVWIHEKGLNLCRRPRQRPNTGRSGRGRSPPTAAKCPRCRSTCPGGLRRWSRASFPPARRCRRYCWSVIREHRGDPGASSRRHVDDATATCQSKAWEHVNMNRTLFIYFAGTRNQPSAECWKAQILFIH